MGLFDSIVMGFGVALTPINLLYCLLGVSIGTLVGVLPGLGPVATISILLPITFGLSPVAALIMLAGIYYGAQYGGSTTAILVNIPGETSSVVTCLDGYPMARQGRAGPALTVSALGSFFAGTVCTLAIAVAAPTLIKFAFKFGPPDYFALMTLGLVAAAILSYGSLLKTFGMIILGLLLGMVGADVNSGVSRYTFNIAELIDGIGFVTVAMGMFGFAEIINNLDHRIKREVFTKNIRNFMLTKQDIKDSWKPILRGTTFGGLLGVLPGGGHVLASFASYMLEKKISKNPSKFGKGAIEGVAGPESANNAGAQTSFIPLLTLGLPANAVMALMLGAMIIQGIQPGPLVVSQKPDLFWGMIASMWIGNIMLVVLNLPLIGLWVKLLSVPYRFLYPAILLFCCIGVYSLNNSSFEIYLAAFFGLLGYIFMKLECEPAPLLLGFILGPLMEEYLRRTMLIYRGDLTVFFKRPISLTLLLFSLFLLVLMVLPFMRRKRKEVFKEEEK